MFQVGPNMSCQAPVQVALLRGWPIYLYKRSPYLVLILGVSGSVGYTLLSSAKILEVALLT
jgi:hypothetical protein